VQYNYDVTEEFLMLHNKIWSPVFTNQIIFAPINEKKLVHLKKKLAHKLNALDIISSLDDPRGLFAYKSALTSMIAYPNFDGYLFAHDDIVMNVSMLSSLNRTSVWFSKRLDLRIEDFRGSWHHRNHSEWHWLNEPWGLDAMNEIVIHEMDVVKELRKCMGSEYKWARDGATSDFFFIPQNMRQLFVRTLGTYGKYNLFLEIAIPMFEKCYVPPSMIVSLPICILYHRRNNLSVIEFDCQEGYGLFHPIKLSSPDAIRITMLKMSL
jgi:hypothetical protein